MWSIRVDQDGKLVFFLALVSIQDVVSGCYVKGCCFSESFVVAS